MVLLDTEVVYKLAGANLFLAELVELIKSCLSLCLCVCLCVNQVGTNHNRFPGHFPQTIPPEHFPAYSPGQFPKIREALRAKIDRISSFLKKRDQFGPKFEVQGVVPHKPFFLSEN